MTSAPASTAPRVFVCSASLRQESLNRKLAALAARVAGETGAAVDLASMDEFAVPLYDGDVEAAQGIPDGATAFHRRLTASDAFIIASPEYNGSMPGGFKNLIDWTSRFRPQPFDGRHGLLMSASPSLAGGNRGLWALRVPFEHLGTRVYPDMFSLSMAFLSLAEAAAHYPCMKRAWVEFLGEPPGQGVDRVDAA
jgi:chromate reductase